MKKRAFSLAFMVAVLALQMTDAVTVMANVTYNYTGNPFTTIHDSSLGTNMTASLTFDSVVTNNYTGTVGVSDLVSWSITTTSGPVTYTSSQNLSYLYSGSFFEFVGGNLSVWSFQVGGTGTAPYEFLTTNADSGEDWVSFDAPWTGLANWSTVPGKWTLESSTPPAPVPALSPSTMLLLIAGLAGLLVHSGRRFRA